MSKRDILVITGLEVLATGTLSFMCIETLIYQYKKYKREKRWKNFEEKFDKLNNEYKTTAQDDVNCKKEITKELQVLIHDYVTECKKELLKN